MQTSLTEELQRSLQTVDQLVKFLTEEKTKGSQAIDEILFSNHPMFEAMRALIRNKYRIYFTNLSEFNQWLDAARSYTPVEEKHWDAPDYREWMKEIRDKGKSELEIIFVKKDLFDEEGNLIPIRPSDWKDEWLRKERRENPFDPTNGPDDIPF